jgi:serine/threonine protein kinase
MEGKLRRDEISSEDPEEVFEMLDIIGEGSYGLICTCRNVKKNKIMAIKFLDIEEEDEAGLQAELDILRECRGCPHIVEYYGCYIKDNTLLIVMEFCEGGSALDILNICKRSFTEEEIAAMMSQMLKGLTFLHSHRILHRDLKAGNVLLDRDGVAKLADFGVSAKLNFTLQKKRTIVGSPYWMAPEVITVTKDNQDGYDLKADIWSLGITAIELADRKPPLFDIASLRVIFLIPARDPPTLKEPSNWSDEFNNFITKCLSKDPKKRPSAFDLSDHPFVRMGSDNEDLLKDLVSDCLPTLNAHRQERKNKQNQNKSSDESLTGTLITVNTSKGTFSTNKEIQYGTTVIGTGNTHVANEESDEEDGGTAKVNSS